MPLTVASHAADTRLTLAADKMAAAEACREPSNPLDGLGYSGSTRADGIRQQGEGTVMVCVCSPQRSARCWRSTA